MCKICEVYRYSGGSSKGAFSTRPCLNTSHPNHAFKKHEKSARHKKLELKLSSSEARVYDHIIVGAEKINLNKRHTNHLYMRKSVHAIYFMIQKNIALSENYGDMMNFKGEKLTEPITKQYLETCSSNSTYTSYTSVASLADAINFYFESKTLKDIYDARFLTLYADESENASHKETFSMFLTYLSSTGQKIKTTFLGIVNLKGKTAAEVMDVIQKFFTAKSLRIDAIFFSVLDGTNSISGKKYGLQRRIRYYAPFGIYINCRNHRLDLCSPHLMKSICLGKIVNDYDTLLLGLWKNFHFSPKRSSILESFQVICGKKPLKSLKAAVTCWLTHDRASERVLDCLLEILEALIQICIDT